MRSPAIRPLVASLLCLLCVSLADADSFVRGTLDDTVTRKLDIPVFFAVPEGSYAPLPEAKAVDATLIQYRHPGSRDSATPLGLRIYSHKPDDSRAASLAASGFIETGDIVLSFRPEWGGSGAYPNIQMGVSHAGVAYVVDGVVRNIDMPLTSEYLGQLNSEHYRETTALHVIRPRGLSAKEKANIAGWAGRLAARAGKIYPAKISFNQDYTAPNYQPGRPLFFVKQLGQLAQGSTDDISLKMYCSEFAWSLLSLRDCDPADPRPFRAEGVPACIHPIFTPLPMSGNANATAKEDSAPPGLSDGPLLAIMSLHPDVKERDRLLSSVFVTDSGRLSKMSPGHKKLSDQMSPLFGELRGVYLGASSNDASVPELRAKFNQMMKDNYSPTSFLILTLPPKDHPARVMDYVGTITYIEQKEEH